MICGAPASSHPHLQHFPQQFENPKIDLMKSPILVVQCIYFIGVSIIAEAVQLNAG